MTRTQQNQIMKQAREIDVICTPFEEAGILGVYIGKLHTFSAARANWELTVQALAVQAAEMHRKSA